MNRLNTRILIIAAIVILVILIIMSLVYVSNKGKIQVPGTSNSTSKEIVPTSPISPKIVITPVFTGANEYIPPITLNAAQEKQELKKKTPLTIDGFTITYDFSSDLFIVTLSEPKTTSKTSFQQWLNQNYPLISLNKFSFK